MRIWKSAFVVLWPVVLMFILTGIAWPHLPERVPIHWDIHGKVDGFAGRGSIWLLPGIALFVLLFIHGINYRLSGSESNPNLPAVNYFSTGVGILLAMLHISSLTNGMQNIWAYPPWIYLGFCFFTYFLGSGIVLAKKDSNCGNQRLLKLSDEKWERLHRFVGRNLMISSVVLLLNSTVWPEPILALGVLLSNILVGMIRSFRMR